MPSSVTFVTSRPVKLDDLLYTLSIYRDPVNFFGTWDCPQCGSQKSTVKGFQDKEALTTACEQRIQEHHTEHHAKKS